MQCYTDLSFLLSCSRHESREQGFLLILRPQLLTLHNNYVWNERKEAEGKERGWGRWKKEVMKSPVQLRREPSAAEGRNSCK